MGKGERQRPGFQFEERNLTQDPEALTTYLDVVMQSDIEIFAAPLILLGVSYLQVAVHRKRLNFLIGLTTWS